MIAPEAKGTSVQLPMPHMSLLLLWKGRLSVIMVANILLVNVSVYNYFTS